jgi:hypothetical protein
MARYCTASLWTEGGAWLRLRTHSAAGGTGGGSEVACSRRPEASPAPPCLYRRGFCATFTRCQIKPHLASPCSRRHWAVSAFALATDEVPSTFRVPEQMATDACLLLDPCPPPSPCSLYPPGPPILCPTCQYQTTRTILVSSCHTPSVLRISSLLPSACLPALPFLAAIIPQDTQPRQAKRATTPSEEAIESSERTKGEIHHPQSVTRSTSTGEWQISRSACTAC